MDFNNDLGIKIANHDGILQKLPEVFVIKESKQNKKGKNYQSPELLIKLNKLAKDRPFCIMYHAKKDDPL
jgi:hypothetical protein